MDASEVLDAIDSMAEALRADGADVHVTEVADGQVRLRLSMEDASCAECVMPAEVLETLFLAALTDAGHTIERVNLEDPREPGSG